jgi:hypothetical protein
MSEHRQQALNHFLFWRHLPVVESEQLGPVTQPPEPLEAKTEGQRRFRDRGRRASARFPAISKMD